VRGLRILERRPRLVAAGVAAVAIFFALPGSWPLSTRLLTAWNAGVVGYLAVMWTLMARAGTDDMRRRARLEDENALIVLGVSVVATVASLGALVAELIDVRDAAVLPQGLRLAIAAFTIVASWFFVHTLFALHYAHDYYRTDHGRGLTFPSPTPHPDYWDFAYFSFTIGAAMQTSDVAVSSRSTRQIVLAQTVFSFLFNTTVLALAVNVGAGLIGH
jgi:uncharacterized membrane protein